MWKKIVVVLLSSLFLISPAIADEFGIGGSWPVKGHSDDRSYGVNNGDKDSYAIVAYYDFEIMEIKNNSFGVNPGFSYKLLRWWKENHNDEDEELIDSHIFTFHLRPYYIFENVKIFAIGGIGYEEAINDPNDDLVVSFGVGTQYYFSEYFSLSFSSQKIYNNPTGDYRRYGMDFVITANFRF